MQLHIFIDKYVNWADPQQNFGVSSMHAANVAANVYVGSLKAMRMKNVVRHFDAILNLSGKTVFAPPSCTCMSSSS